jgi:cysteinyl-tRNA synthetase
MRGGVHVEWKTVLLCSLVFLSGCDESPAGSGDDTSRDYRQDMRDFVMDISGWAKRFEQGFIVIPQNGSELITEDGEEDGAPSEAYLSAIDGAGREDLFYGYDDDNVATLDADRDYLGAFMDIAEHSGVEVLTTDYCWTPSFVDKSYAGNESRGYVSFAADHRELDNIPEYPFAPWNANTGDIESLADAKNFLYLLNPGEFETKDMFIDAIQATDYDMVIIDLFFNGDRQLDASDIQSLKQKKNGGSRLVIAYMSIGEAEDYRYYWNARWKDTPPSWLAGENPSWEGNYKVRYWDSGWQNIIYGNDSSYLKKILDAGFDGVYLDIIDAFEYFEGGTE